MKKLNVPLLVALLACCFGLTSAALASPVGTLNLANCTNGLVTVTATDITWTPAGTAPNTGCINTGGTTNLTWSGGTILGGVTGDIMNLHIGGGVLDHFITLPTSTPNLDFALAGFGTGSSNTNCVSATSVGDSCSVVAGSPFVLTYQGLLFGIPTTTVSLGAHGTVYDAAGAAYWSGGFSTQLNLTPAEIQANFARSGSISSTYSGQFTLSTVPEPVSAGLIGTGLVALALIRRKKVRS